MGPFGQWERCQVEKKIFFFWLNSQISLTRVHPHMKLGRDIEFGDAHGIAILKFV